MARRKPKGVIVDPPDPDLKELDGYSVDIEDEATGGNVLETRVGKGLNERIEDTGLGIPFQPDFIMDPTGKPEKWYIHIHDVTLGGLTCSHCRSRKPKEGVIAYDDKEEQFYAVVQCPECEGYLFTAVKTETVEQLKTMLENIPRG